MDKPDREEIVQRYESWFKQYGYSPRSLGWGEDGRQSVRFSVLAEYALNSPGSSVLDVGCGFADLYDFLQHHGWQGSYTGIDIVPGLIDTARQRHPDLDIREMDITGDCSSLERPDFAIASGTMNTALTHTDNLAHIEAVLKTMVTLCRTAVCVDFMTTWVDYKKPGAWHTDPGWALKTAKRLSRRVNWRGDYMPYEFSLFIFKDDHISSQRVFSAYEKTLNDEPPEDAT